SYNNQEDWDDENEEGSEGDCEENVETEKDTDKGDDEKDEDDSNKDEHEGFSFNVDENKTKYDEFENTTTAANEVRDCEENEFIENVDSPTDVYLDSPSTSSHAEKGSGDLIPEIRTDRPFSAASTSNPIQSTTDQDIGLTREKSGQADPKPMKRISAPEKKKKNVAVTKSKGEKRRKEKLEEEAKDLKT
ncbi:serine/threonine-protein kinase rio2-like, partial [Copidosoma floridanum]|uniref:serine/threonine-protein kinase rio2-like n=1 Tax=Copidosoma floridanum TaxID=29053 RepID=UPI0006C97D8E